MNRYHRRKLAEFGQTVLEILEDQKSWSADTLDAISDAACDMKLGRSDESSHFVYIRAKQEPKE